MKAEIRKEYRVSETREISVDFNGCNYLIIYGRHINGWFISIPNWNICVEAAEPSATVYNGEKLAAALKDTDIGRHLAEAIKTHWEGKE